MVLPLGTQKRFFTPASKETTDKYSVIIATLERPGTWIDPVKILNGHYPTNLCFIDVGDNINELRRPMRRRLGCDGLVEHHIVFKLRLPLCGKKEDDINALLNNLGITIQEKGLHFDAFASSSMIARKDLYELLRHAVEYTGQAERELPITQEKHAIADGERQIPTMKARVAAKPQRAEEPHAEEPYRGCVML
ncbi:MAG: hypothetical protein K0S08_2061 [Gammaproteobacteria bacterium]|jgi:hypothetical protein|nr:hypothetical protein [Gammaproteobacteria bacterium]